MNDKRRYRSKSPRNPKSPKGMEEEMSGNPALDGFTVRHRQPLKRDPFAMHQDSRHSEHYAAGSMMDEHEARFSEIYGDD
jgi:hypothetical protein